MQRSTDLLKQFTIWLEKEGKSPNTLLTYEREMQRFEERLLELGTSLQELTQENVQDYISFLERQGRSPITTDKIIGVIRTFSKFLKRPEIVYDIQMKPVEKKEDFEILSTQECENLLNQVKKDGHKRNIAIVYTLLHTGIRVSELCALTKSDIDFDNNQIVVYSFTGEQRVIPLSREAKFYLSDYCESAKIQHAVFVSRSNERLTERSVQYMLKKYDVHPHKLRHTFCQQLVDKGISIEIVSKLAGHKDINVTKKYVKSRIKHMELEDAIRKTFYNDTLG